MSVIVSDVGKDFERIEPGLHQAVCSHVVNLDLQDTKFGPKHKVALCFELKELMQDQRPYMQSQIYTASLNEKAVLRQHLESWRGRKMDDQEVMGFDLEVLVGVNCMLNLMETTRGEKTYTNITSINKLPKGYEQIRPVGQPAPEWLRKKAAEGMERAAQHDGASAVHDQTAPPHSDADFIPSDDSMPF